LVSVHTPQGTVQILGSTWSKYLGYIDKCHIFNCRIHTQTFAYVCGGCDKQFNKKALKKHICGENPTPRRKRVLTTKIDKQCWVLQCTQILENRTQEEDHLIYDHFKVCLQGNECLVAYCQILKMLCKLRFFSLTSMAWAIYFSSCRGPACSQEVIHTCILKTQPLNHVRASWHCQKNATTKSCKCV
jgi:hypothetical protein